MKGVVVQHGLRALGVERHGQQSNRAGDCQDGEGQTELRSSIQNTALRMVTSVLSAKDNHGGATRSSSTMSVPQTAGSVGVGA